MIIDVHAHIWKADYKGSSDTLIKAADAYGIDRIYVSGLGELVPDEDEVAELNGNVHGLMKRDGRIHGYCYLNPRNGNSTEELKRCIEDYGMSAIKLWVSVFCDDPLVYPIMEASIDYDIPVLIHAFYKATGQLPNETLGINVGNLAKRYPQSRIIMAHLGANAYSELKSIRRYENVWADYSGTLFRRDELEYTRDILGVDRLLFGTDMDLAPILLKLGQLDDTDFTREEKDMVLYKNALKVFR